MPHIDGIPAELFAFGTFELHPGRRLLLDAGVPVPVGSRALAILTALVEHAGELVSKEELISLAWPDTVVEDGNLKFHVAALRRALGDGRREHQYIVNVPSRGYRFDGPIDLKVPKALLSEPADSEDLSPTYQLPQVLTRIIGRASVVSSIGDQVKVKRFVSLVGPGGIGKTTVAIAVASRLVASFRGGVAFVDLAPVASPHLVSSALATALGLPVRSEDAVPAIVASLAEHSVLLVMDSCEHVVDAVATLCENLLRSLPGLHVLATSREPLRAEAEHVVRLPPLTTPQETDAMSSREAMAYSSIELLVERASMQADVFRLSDEAASLAAEICRRLDGNALAIEMAASRIRALGMKGVAEQLDDRFRLLRSAWRGAIPRHQSLVTTLDWSHELLPPVEQLILRRLGVFAGYFSLIEAAEVLIDDDLTHEAVVTGLANLVNKSLVAAQFERAFPRYRLLDTTRAYAQKQLVDHEEYDRAAKRHALYFMRVLERSYGDAEEFPSEVDQAERDSRIANVRVAVDWAFSPGGEVATGIALTIASSALWFSASLINECGRRVRLALEYVEPGSRQEMQLLHALGIVLYSDGPGQESKSTWSRALEIAERLEDVDYRIRALWGLWITDVHGGRYREGLTLAHRFYSLADENDDRTAGWVAERLIATSLHLLGEQVPAQRHFRRMFSQPISSTRRSQIARFQFDQSVLGHSFHARSLWLLGLPDQAMREAGDSVRSAQEMRHGLSLCYALGVAACPIALLVGDIGAARVSVPMLLAQSAKHVLPVWNSVGKCFDGLLRLEFGDTSRGLAQLELGSQELHADNWVLYHTASLLDHAEALARAGDLVSATANIERAQEQALRHEELWCMPEILRIKGEVLLLTCSAACEEDARELFIESFELAKGQSALSWQLRSAMSLVRLARQFPDDGVADDRLVQTFASFEEGFGTKDLLEAQELIRRRT